MSQNIEFCKAIGSNDPKFREASLLTVKHTNKNNKADDNNPNMKT